MDKVLEIKNLSVVERQKGRLILDNINLHLSHGKIMGLVGETGSGKTVLSYSILSLLSDKFKIEGEINYLGKNILTFSQQEKQAMRGEEISMIFQEPLSALNPLHIISKQISEALILKNADIKQKTIDQKISEIFKIVKLGDKERILKSLPHQISGGQRQRVMLAIAIINRPKILLADEPTSSLDAVLRLQTIDYLKKLTLDFNMAMIFISHSIKEVARIADSIACLKDGKLLEFGSANQVLKRPKSLYVKQLLEQKKIKRTSPNKQTKSELVVKNFNLSFVNRTGILNMGVSLTKVLKDINLEIKSGQTLGVLGESGSGKTSLALAILRLVKNTRYSGEILINNNNWTGLGQKYLTNFRADAQIVFQDPFSSLSPRMTIGEIIKEGLDLHKKNLDRDQKTRLVLEALNQVDLCDDIIQRYPHEFSGGQRQRIALARAIILEPKLIIMDEPTSSLDNITERKIISLLEKLQRKLNLSYLIISHDLDVISQISDMVVILKEGRIIEANTCLNIISKPKHAYSKLLINSYNYQKT